MSRPAKEPPQTFAGKVAGLIRARRVKAGLSVEEASRRAGVPAQTWYHWEQASRLPLDAVAAAAKALKCRPKDLVP